MGRKRHVALIIKLFRTTGFARRPSGCGLTPERAVASGSGFQADRLRQRDATYKVDHMRRHADCWSGELHVSAGSRVGGRSPIADVPTALSGWQRCSEFWR